MARSGFEYGTQGSVFFIYFDFFGGCLNLISRVSRAERYCYSLCGFKSVWNRSVVMAFRFVSFLVGLATFALYF